PQWQLADRHHHDADGGQDQGRECGECCLDEAAASEHRVGTSIEDEAEDEHQQRREDEGEEQSHWLTQLAAEEGDGGCSITGHGHDASSLRIARPVRARNTSSSRGEAVRRSAARRSRAVSSLRTSWIKSPVPWMDK